MIAGLQRQRELADYEPGTVFDAGDGREQIGEIRRFGERVVAQLRAEGR